MLEELLLDGDGVVAYITEIWPEMGDYYRGCISNLTSNSARLTKPVTDQDLRPGGTVSGPFLMRLADAAAYVMMLARLGREALAVTSSLSIDFLRRPTGPQVVADVTLQKLGRSLAVCTVGLCSVEPGGQPDMTTPEAISTVTYSLSLTSQTAAR